MRRGEGRDAELINVGTLDALLIELELLDASEGALQVAGEVEESSSSSFFDPTEEPAETRRSSLIPSLSPALQSDSSSSPPGVCHAPTSEDDSSLTPILYMHSWDESHPRGWDE